MASSVDVHAGSTSNSKEIRRIMSVDKNRQPNKNRRKNPKPRHLSSYGKTNTPVQPSETETKSKGKMVSLKTDSDAKQMKKKKNTTSSKQKLLVLKESVPENLPIPPQPTSDQCSDLQDRPENVKNPEGCGFELEQCVKIIRQLECSGHVDSNFRQKFLTWFGLKATAQEINIVKTFVHSFKDDQMALAEQFVDTFSDRISKKDYAISDYEGCDSSGALCKKPRH